MEIRICSRCDEKQAAEEFRGEKGRICRACIQAAKNVWAQKQRDSMTVEERAAHNQKAKESGTKWRKKNQTDYKEYHKARHQRGRAYMLTFLTKCVKCGEDDPVTLKFHHKVPREGEGKGVSGMSNRTLELIKAEIDKCDVLCANCHTKVHYFIDEDGRRKRR